MSANNYIFLIFIGLFAGILSGLFGLGGGIVVVPALVYFLKMSQHQAQGTSLAMLLFPIGFLGIWQYYQEGALKIEYALYIALFFLLGAYIGAGISLKTDQKKIQYFFIVYLCLSAVKLLFF